MSESDAAPGGGPDPTEPRSQFSGLLKPLAWIDGAIARFEAVVLAIGVMIMATVSVANVIGRFVLGESLFFVEELNRFLIVLITFVGLGYAARMGRHIRMSALYDSLPDRARKILMIVICLVTSAVMFVLAWYAYIYVVSVYDTGRIAPSLRIPVYLTFVWVPIGFVITGIQYLLTAVANLTRPDVYISASVVDTYEDTETQV
ncbi:TRAP transporter small permease [Roseospira marina]|uniref:TRAP transporter small permease protein n=1 Tax=Roseospira marina TaxID=140057 RepID=A0A5M6I8T2_9PROT|nr:TRAP transporter small permease [Roseospira marina]KAA5604108.1 TRAP transporter small permease [Roseospira marina]MBB4315792.1 TRAP-type C4-dicarboxylate transport system permease small subunit [Roseospira marina]MBB5088969.1 TRAP-type C4-dicarboxylate transport system permease small subunit [Roseospira marina]